MPAVVERITPGTVTIATFEDHEARYQFAGPFVEGKRVLDIACGAGIGTSYLLRTGARFCTGVDVSQEAISYAVEHFPGPRYIQGDALSLPLGDEIADVVVSFETIEHVSDPQRFLAECYRVLVAGGLFIGSTPHDPVYRWSHPDHNPFHLHEFSAGELAGMLSAKFRDVQLFAQAPVIYPKTVATQLCVRVLNVLRLTEVALRALGKSRMLTECKRTEYEFATEGSSIRPYRPSWLRQPTVVVAIATK